MRFKALVFAILVLYHKLWRPEIFFFFHLKNTFGQTLSDQQQHQEDVLRSPHRCEGYVNSQHFRKHVFHAFALRSAQHLAKMGDGPLLPLTQMLPPQCSLLEWRTWRSWVSPRGPPQHGVPSTVPSSDQLAPKWSGACMLACVYF